MKIGICIDHSLETLETQLKTAQQHGFSCGQLVSWNPALWTETEAARVAGLCETYGITLTAFWCGWEGPKQWNFTEGPTTLGLVPVAFRYARMKNLTDGAAFAARLGLRDVVSHMGFIPENPDDPQYGGLVVALRSVAQTLQKNRQNLLFETGQETPVTLLRLFADVGTGNLFVNLDPANLLMYGKANPVDATELFGNRILGVHAKDGLYPTDGHHLGDEVKLGMGKVDFPALVTLLRQAGYQGSLTIEREISGPQQLADILEAREFLQSILG